MQMRNRLPSARSTFGLDRIKDMKQLRLRDLFDRHCAERREDSSLELRSRVGSAILSACASTVGAVLRLKFNRRPSIEERAKRDAPLLFNLRFFGV